MGKNRIRHKREDISLNRLRQDVGYPVFCFKHLQTASMKGCKDSVFRHFVDRVVKLSNLGWQEINKSARHSYGSEIIDRKQIKRQLPDWITEDIKLHVFRYSGDNKPFIATRDGNVLHVIFIEANFGEIYDHD